MRSYVLILIMLLPLPAYAQTTVVEMFTTSACTPCHPADELLVKLQSENPENLIALSCHIPGMGDASKAQNLALKACKERVSYYYRTDALDTASTPTALINGLHQSVGNDENDMRAGLNKANPIQSIALKQNQDEIEITLPKIKLEKPADIWVFSYLPQTQAELKDGTILNYTGLIKDLQKISQWDGSQSTLKIKTEKLPANGFAVLAQKHGGEILAAGKIEIKISDQ